MWPHPNHFTSGISDHVHLVVWLRSTNFLKIYFSTAKLLECFCMAWSQEKQQVIPLKKIDIIKLCLFTAIGPNIKTVLMKHPWHLFWRGLLKILHGISVLTIFWQLCPPPPRPHYSWLSGLESCILTFGSVDCYIQQF